MSVGTAKAKQSKARGQNRAVQDSSFFSPIAIGTFLFFLFTVLFFLLGPGLFLIDFAFDFRLDSHYRTVFGFSLILSVFLGSGLQGKEKLRYNSIAMPILALSVPVSSRVGRW